jgi:hypothetical protein
VPAANAITTPDVGFTVAVAVLEDNQLKLGWGLTALPFPSLATAVMLAVRPTAMTVSTGEVIVTLATV